MRRTVCWLSEAYARTPRGVCRDKMEDVLDTGAARIRARRESMSGKGGVGGSR